MKQSPRQNISSLVASFVILLATLFLSFPAQQGRHSACLCGTMGVLTPAAVHPARQASPLTTHSLPDIPSPNTP